MGLNVKIAGFYEESKLIKVGKINYPCSTAVTVQISPSGSTYIGKV